MIRRFIKSLLLITITLVLVNNGNANAQPPVLEKSFIVKDYNVKISFPNKWRVETKNKNPFDLQCTNGSSFASVFVFYKTDLKEGQTPLDIFRIQNEDITSKRLNVKIIAEEKTVTVGSKQIRSMLFSAERDDSENYYYCNLVEFGENSDRFIWILFTSLPSYALANLETMDKIVASCVLIK